MDHALRVRILQRITHLARDPQRVLDRELLVTLQSIAQRLALDEGHHVKHDACHLTGVEQRQDVRMLQIGRGANLAQEPLGAEDGGEFRLEDLERHAPVVAHVVREIDRRHPAGPELALDAIAVGEGVAKVGERVGHCDA